MVWDDVRWFGDPFRRGCRSQGGNLLGVPIQGGAEAPEAPAQLAGELEAWGGVPTYNVYGPEMHRLELHGDLAY